MERTKGHVVGKDPFRGVMTWVVKVTEEKNPHFNKKLLVASVVDGVTLAGGLSVDFIIGDRNGSPVAVDAAPRGIKEQGKRKMRKLWMGVIAALCAIVIALGAVIFQGPIGKAIADWRIWNAMETALERVEAMGFEIMVTDETVAKTVKHQHAGVYGAKAVLLERNFCRPVFGEPYTGNRCWWALYYSHESDGAPNTAYAERGIPDTSGALIDSIRKAMMEKARKHLRDPQRLEAFYNKRKAAALAAFRELPKEEQGYRAERLDGVKRAFERFYDPDVQERYADYTQAHDAWWSRVQQGHAAYNSPEDQERSRLYRVMKEKQEALYERTPDFHSTLMAGRRHKEGGKELVAMWVSLLQDAQASIK